MNDVLQQGASYGQGPALRARITFLDGQLGRIGELVRDAEARLERQLTTVSEVESLRLRGLRLRRKLSSSRQELAILEAQGWGTGDPSRLRIDLASYERGVMNMEERRSRLRRLTSWDVQVKVGVAAADQGEWFGMLSFSYDLGQLWQAHAEDRYLDARRDELRESDAELRDQLAHFLGAMQASSTELRSELALVDDELAGMRSRLEDLRRLESGGARDRLAGAELDLIDLESDQVFLRSLLAEREALTTKAP